MVRHTTGLALSALLAVTACAQNSTPATSPRSDILLNARWRFIKQDLTDAQASAGEDSAWLAVNLPHTWNNLDGQDGKAAQPDLPDGYYRGAGWYAKTLDVPVA